MKKREPVAVVFRGSKTRCAVDPGAWERPGPVLTLCGGPTAPGYSLPPGAAITCKRCLAILAEEG